VVERKREIYVQDVAEARARVAEPQAESHVAQQPGSLLPRPRAAPGAADVAENGASHAHQAKRVPIGVDALLDGQ